jgi:hypothetical protein
VIPVFAPALVPAADGVNALPGPDVVSFDATGVTGQVQAEAAAILFASGRQMEADGLPGGLAIAAAAQDPQAHQRVESRPPTPAGTGSMNGVALLAAGQRGTTGLPLVPPGPALRPPATAEEVPPPEAKPADRNISSFAAEAADLLTHALSVSLATADRAMRDLTGADADGHPSGVAVLYWLGLSSWVVSGALAYEMARRRMRVAPAVGGWAFSDEDDPFLEGMA